MNVRQIPRTAVDSYLKIVRVTIGGAIAMFPGNGTGAKPAATLVVDRADATIRAIIASILGDPVLGEDAERRRVAAQEREQALRLRVEAERTAEQADARLEERRDRADRQREQANKRAKAQRDEAARRREEKTRRAAKAETQRREDSRKAAERADRAVNSRAPKRRLETLNAKSGALQNKEQELTARDEARRLREAAGGAKAERKNGSS